MIYRIIKKAIKSTSLFKKIRPSYRKKLVDIIDVQKNPCVYVSSFGSKNTDKEFYVIYGHKAGFFSNLQFVLAHIRQAELLGMIPVVDFMNFPNVYNVDREIYGSKNSWDYYFEPITKYSLDEVYSSAHVNFCSGKYSWDLGYYLSDKNLLDFYKRYIVPQKYILDEIEQFYTANMKGKKVLGIHFRGNEQNVAPGHPFCPTIHQMLRTTDEIIDKYHIDHIYLVTEEQKFVDVYSKKYGDVLLLSPYYRTYDKNGYFVKPPRNDHIYLLGKEIMVGAYLLARCNGLLHSSSNVSEFSRFLNDNQYDFRYEIKNGVNSNDPYIAKHLYQIKKILPSRFGGLLNQIDITEKC